MPAAAAALAMAGAWWLLARRARSVATDLEAAHAALNRHATSIVFVVSVIAGAVSAIFATNSASGADASGYLSEAAQWASGQLFYREPIATVVGTGDPWVTSPLGWRPGPAIELQSPTYPPGLPLLMALPHALGGAAAASLVVTLAAALTVLATGLLASHFAGGTAGIVAAIAIATSPVFLFQSVQPMSDVPVTAAWMLTWLLLARGSPRVTLAGLACALAVLIRPNLAPLAAVPLFAIGWNARRLIAFSVPVAVAALALMWLQWQWYGSPFRSGYGTADELFALANVGANASRYFSWLITTSPLLLLAPVGAALVWRQAPARAMAAFASLVVAAYLVYAAFDVWSYLRFLLPALAVAAVFTGAATTIGLSRVPTALRPAAVAAVALGLVAHGVSQARSLDAFRLAGQQRRVAQVAAYLATSLPADAVVVAGEQSGALRYYTGRSIVRWDAASQDAVSDAIATLHAQGRTIVVALDAWEGELFRAKFSALPMASLEWPPSFEAGTSHRTRVWRLSDRDSFLRGERVATERQP